MQKLLFIEAPGKESRRHAWYQSEDIAHGEGGMKKYVTIAILDFKQIRITNNSDPSKILRIISPFTIFFKMQIWLLNPIRPGGGGGPYGPNPFHIAIAVFFCRKSVFFII